MKAKSVCLWHSKQYSRELCAAGGRAVMRKAWRSRQLPDYEPIEPITSVEQARELLGVLIAEMRNLREPAREIVNAIGSFAKLEEVYVMDRQLKKIAIRMGLMPPGSEEDNALADELPAEGEILREPVDIAAAMEASDEE